LYNLNEPIVKQPNFLLLKNFISLGGGASFNLFFSYSKIDATVSTWIRVVKSVQRTLVLAKRMFLVSGTLKAINNGQ